MKITITPTEKLISISDLDRSEFPRNGPRLGRCN